LNGNIEWHCMQLELNWKFNEMQIGGEDIGNLFVSMVLKFFFKNKKCIKVCIQNLFHTKASYLWKWFWWWILSKFKIWNDEYEYSLNIIWAPILDGYKVWWCNGIICEVCIKILITIIEDAKCTFHKGSEC
jgi:hypothetical protein